MSNVQLIMDGRAYDQWLQVDVLRSIENIAGSFSLSCADEYDGAAIVKGSECIVQLDNKNVIVGYVDDVQIAHSPSEHSITVYGRDKTADAVDCSAQYKTGEWLNQKMDRIALDLVSEYGLSVKADTDLGAPFKKWNIELGERVFDNIDRMARHRGVLVTSDGAGGILLTRPGSSRAPADLVAGRNILSGSSYDSNADRYSEYKVIAQGVQEDETSPDVSTQVSAVSKDKTVKRTRRLIELFEEPTADRAVLQRRADWRRNINAARSQRCSIITQGWLHDGALWKPNTLTRVSYPRIRRDNEELLIVSCRYQLDSQGTRTELTLAPANGYQVFAEPEVEDEE